jgi:hypothetical protein
MDCYCHHLSLTIRCSRSHQSLVGFLAVVIHWLWSFFLFLCCFYTFIIVDLNITPYYSRHYHDEPWSCFYQLLIVEVVINHWWYCYQSVIKIIVVSAQRYFCCCHQSPINVCCCSYTSLVDAVVIVDHYQLLPLWDRPVTGFGSKSRITLCNSQLFVYSTNIMRLNTTLF